MGESGVTRSSGIGEGGDFTRCFSTMGCTWDSGRSWGGAVGVACGGGTVCLLCGGPGGVAWGMATNGCAGRDFSRDSERACWTGLEGGVTSNWGTGEAPRWGDTPLPAPSSVSTGGLFS